MLADVKAKPVGKTLGSVDAEAVGNMLPDTL